VAARDDQSCGGPRSRFAASPTTAIRPTTTATESRYWYLALGVQARTNHRDHVSRRSDDRCQIAPT
jgi:hypothetical protein